MKDLRGWIRTVSLLLLVAGLSGGAHAAITNVAFKWKANTEPDLAGYKLYYGTAPGTYASSVTLGRVTNYVMTNLTVGTTYYFALSAFNTNDLESGLTPELQFPSPPVLAAIGNRTTPEDTALNVTLLVSDADTPLSSLTLSATSTNTTLVPNANVTFTGTSSNRTMRITPAANQSGTTRITVTVSDGAGTDSQSFLLTVSGTPDAPTISGIADVTTDEDVQTAALAFTVSDQETPAGSLTVTAASTNPSLIPTNRITLGGTGGSRTVVLRPVTNASGSATITLTVSDGGLSANTAFNFTVRAVNDTPTITPIADLSLPEDTQSSPIAFTIGDVETTPNNLQVTASSSDPAIVPQLGFTLGGTGTNRTVVVRPATNAIGSALITISVSDGQGSAAETFTVTYTALNDAPYVSQPADVVLNRFDPVPPISIAVWDAETAASALTITLSSSNTALLPAATNMVLTGTGTNRTLTLIPIGFGTTRVGIRVSDGAATNSSFFQFTVTGSNDPPVVTSIADVTTDEDVATGAISFTVSDLDTPAASLTVTAASSNPTLIPTNRITLGGSGNARTVTLRPATNQNGSASITLTVSDGGLTASTTFNFTVRAVNDVPTISVITNMTFAEDTASGPIAFTINDIDTAAGSLQVTASSSDTVIVPQPNITLGGTGTNRTVVVRPTTNAIGTLVITITVSDGQGSASEPFAVTYTTVNDAPYVSQPADVVVNKFNPVPPVPFTIRDSDTGDASGLNVTLTSTNTALLPTSTNMVVNGTGTNRTITLIPIGVGTTRVGIDVSDGVVTTSTSFQFTVTSSNNPPVLTVPGALSGTAGTAIAVRGISVADPDAKTNNMNFTISAPNGTLAVATTVSGGVTASQVSGNNSGAVTIIAPLAALNATFANANGLRYTSRTDFRGTETLVLTVSDNGFTGLGGIKTDTENIAIQITGGATGIEGWRGTYFSAADLQDPTKEATVWGDLADPDNDGRDNLMEYALGLNPLGSEPQDAAFVSSTVNVGGNQYQTLTFNARVNDTTLQYIPEVSADNATWAATAILVSTTPVNADFQRVTYRDSVAITTDSARFMRLRVVRNTP